jgi:hypothetical protein
MMRFNAIAPEWFSYCQRNRRQPIGKNPSWQTTKNAEQQKRENNYSHE